MRNLKFVKFACSVGRSAASGIRRGLGAVNPDVWRELACVSLSSYSLLLPKREEIRPAACCGNTPIVLVHGVGGNRGTWTPFRLYLRLTGFRGVYAFGYEKGAIEEHAENLKRFVEDVIAATGEPRVDLVAHSLGGIVARYAIQRLDLLPRVRTLVTLATPHHGTYAAHYANTPLITPLRPDSDLIRGLNADGIESYPERFVAVYSDRDIYVIPADSMTHPHARNVFVPGHSHAQHLISTRIFRVVAANLGFASNYGAVTVQA